MRRRRKATLGTERAGGATQVADTGDGRTIDFSIRNTLADISATRAEDEWEREVLVAGAVQQCLWQL